MPFMDHLNCEWKSVKKPVQSMVICKDHSVCLYFGGLPIMGEDNLDSKGRILIFLDSRHNAPEPRKVVRKRAPKKETPTQEPQAKRKGPRKRKAGRL